MVKTSNKVDADNRVIFGKVSDVVTRRYTQSFANPYLEAIVEAVDRYLVNAYLEKGFFLMKERVIRERENLSDRFYSIYHKVSNFPQVGRDKRIASFIALKTETGFALHSVNDEGKYPSRKPLVTSGDLMNMGLNGSTLEPLRKYIDGIVSKMPDVLPKQSYTGQAQGLFNSDPLNND
ncbi:MAG: hypothetical protein WC654_07580 [Patescibacteria group bacterium]